MLYKARFAHRRSVPSVAPFPSRSAVWILPSYSDSVTIGGSSLAQAK